MASLLAGLSALLQLLNELWAYYRTEKEKAEVREEVRNEQATLNNEAKADAAKVDAGVGSLSDAQLDERLRGYFRD